MTARTLLLTTLAMLAFAGNSLFCRMALKHTSIDPASFTSLRVLSGALALWLLLSLHHKKPALDGDWYGALALFVYAAAFSFAYLSLDAGVGALLLFGAVQLSMIAWGLLRGERMRPWQVIGLLLAIAGLLVLLLPGSNAPPLGGTLLMVLSGIAWGAYSLLGRSTADALSATAGNFIRAIPLAALLSLLLWTQHNWDGAGVFYALLSGALTSGVGYAIWYSALRGLGSMQAASVQLSVPVLTALGASLLLSEAMTARLILSSVAILGGITLVLRVRQRG